jgi:mono/diheme cytochrome c family protein
MPRRASLLAMLVMGLGLVSSARAQSDDIAQGRALAERLCVKCHLNPGQGEKSGPGSIPGFRAVAGRPGQSLHGVVGWLKGIPPMMPNHRLTQDEMFLLAQYILSLRGEP